MPELDFQTPKIDFNKTHATRPRMLRKTLLVAILLFIITPLFLLYALVSDTQGFITLPKMSWIKQLGYLITSKDKDLKNSNGNRINILLAGVGGDGHDGPQLTDTIILASLDTQTKKVALLSIPRDLYVPMPLAGYGWRKINNVNAYGEMDKVGSGMPLLAQSVEKIFNIPIHYYIKVDFRAFKDVVDQLDGITVDVDNSFSDYQYPTYDYKTQTISFEKGKQHFDGERALQFVRSRHGNNGEGSDFGRSRRQQKVIMAIKDKALASYGIMNIGKIINVINALQKNISTNLEPWEIVKIAQDFKNVNFDDIEHVVLDDSPKNLLYSSITPDGAYILLPKGNNFKPLADLAQGMLSSTNEQSNEQQKNLEVPVAKNKNLNTTNNNQNSTNNSTNSTGTPDKINLIIQNGSGITGLAQKAAGILSGSSDYNIISSGNAKTFDYSTTVIYDTSDGSHSGSLTTLKAKLDADIAPGLTPEIENVKKSNPTVDFVIILGKN